MFISKKEHERLKFLERRCRDLEILEDLVCKFNCNSEQCGCNFGSHCIKEFCKTFNIPIS